MELETIALLLTAAALAGWFDAIVGGGGLLQLPMLMLAMPMAPTASILATDKLSSICGTTAAGASYVRRTGVERRLALRTGLPAVALSAAGAAAAAAVPTQVMMPIVLGALVGVLVLVVGRPAIGAADRPDVRTPRRAAIAVGVVGLALPFYNGFVGPGTGTMMLVALTALLGMDFVVGSATVKVINVGSNLGALLLFTWHGSVLWSLGLAMAVCNVFGGQLGVRMAVTRGNAFVRRVLVCVTSALIVRLGIGLAL